VVCPLSNLVEELGGFAEKALPTKTTSAKGKVKEATKTVSRRAPNGFLLRAVAFRRRAGFTVGQPSRVLPVIVVILRAAKNVAVVFHPVPARRCG